MASRLPNGEIEDGWQNEFKSMVMSREALGKEEGRVGSGGRSQKERVRKWDGAPCAGISYECAPAAVAVRLEEARQPS